ncbi:hypothetical protein [Tepidibacillus decaturensis]|uniref:Uncharacterized protein n=1 Tax=Tepidibacillus decaturensis TaxID=1413211 RepID=A0A135L725_9BACI|nr:hypothetical protein [Tepidibacillus decaturensis]KXG44805.1 hypothetical protein U473_12825 [Tepidibacillus decaturensis]
MEISNEFKKRIATTNKIKVLEEEIKIIFRILNSEYCHSEQRLELWMKIDLIEERLKQIKEKNCHLPTKKQG